MEEDKISKEEKQTLRREKLLLRQAKQSSYVKELIDDLEDRPEEVSCLFYTKRIIYCWCITLPNAAMFLQIRESVGAESRELTRYLAKQEELARQEEELFTRAPITKRDKKLEKYMKSRNGYAGMLYI